MSTLDRSRYLTGDNNNLVTVKFQRSNLGLESDLVYQIHYLDAYLVVWLGFRSSGSYFIDSGSLGSSLSKILAGSFQL